LTGPRLFSLRNAAVNGYFRKQTTSSLKQKPPDNFTALNAIHRPQGHTTKLAVKDSLNLESSRIRSRPSSPNRHLNNEQTWRCPAKGCMTITPLPQVAGFVAPIGGGFWAPTDTQRPSLAKGLLQHSQGHRPWKGSNRKTHLANGHSQQSRVVTTALITEAGRNGFGRTLSLVTPLPTHHQSFPLCSSVPLCFKTHPSSTHKRVW
jgi:hypothetical protein